MRKVLLILLISIFAYTAYPKQVDETTAKNVAKTYFSNVLEQKNIIVSDFIVADKYTSNESLLKDNTPEIVYFYIFNLSGSKGFIIVSGDDNVEPVLGYSTEGYYNSTNISANFKYWLNQYKLQIKAVIDKKVNSSEAISHKWNELNKGAYGLNKTLKKSHSPLMNITWDQGCYYNALCPTDALAPNGLCSRVPTGCTATAMAQIMKYWNYPATGTGFNNYYTMNYGLQSANFGGTSYDWTGMPAKVTVNNSAVATLMYHCGVSVYMNYGTYASGAWVIASDNDACAQNAYWKYFSYDSTSLQGLRRSEFPDSAWIKMLKREIDNGRPIQYAGFDNDGGHTFIFDGYDSDNKFNVNWGWSGYQNGYFVIDVLNPATYNFEFNQEALIGIQPKATKQQNNSFIRISETTVCPNNTIYFDAWGEAVSYLWSFGDNSSDINIQNTSHKYTTAGLYPIQVKMTDTLGHEIILRDTINVVDNLPFSEINSKITIAPNPVCPNSAVVFRAEGKATAFVWNFGDGSPTTSKSYTEHTYTTTGTFSVSLKITNACGKDTVLYRDVIVELNAPITNINYSISPNPVCPHTVVSFYTWGDAVSAEWNFGDGSSKSKGFQANHKYSSIGNFVVSLKLTNICGNDTVIYDTVRIVNYLPAIDAQFSISSNKVCPNTLVDFSAVGGFSYLWDFGDNSPAMKDANTYHIYAKPGKYIVRVKVTNGCGNDSTLTDTVIVVNNSPITFAYMFSSLSSACPNENLTFFCWGDGDFYTWDFGDGSPLYYSEYGEHAYASPGTYNVSLKMSNYCGNDTTLYTTIKIANNVTPSPPYLNIYPNPVCPGDTVNFQAWENVDSFIWKYDDASPADTAYYAYHAFSAAGDYDISCQITNKCGKKAIAHYIVHVQNVVPLTSLQYDFSPKTICPGETVTFSASGDGGSFIWDFGDATPPVMLSNTKHLYTSVGKFPVILKMSNHCGKDTTVTDTVYVTQNAFPDPVNYVDTVSQSVACPGDTIIFSARHNGASKYLWDFGDGLSDTNTTQYIDYYGYINDIVRHAYTDIGYYNATLTLSNQCGNTFTKNFPILIGDASPVNGNFWWIDYSMPNTDMRFYASGGSSYKWNFGDGTPEVTTDKFPVIHNFARAGIFNISVVISNSCGNSRIYQNNIYVGAYAVKENVKKQDLFLIYPNPNNGNFSLQFLNSVNDAATLEIINLCGQTIFTKQFNSASGTVEQINLSGKPKGIYFVKMQTKTTSFVKKLVIQ